ncbi:hypothetical protein Nepgr_033840 [Nepenthes gracilis]|uniref:Uncharacterized protein n=1 Tax=Nepenthes gracilis TaxID=150966 RepID=A0AAD3Y954_NEPGR|nr:hypothetical protein Nepgr_033840 [Nepenthes gracilis]
MAAVALARPGWLMVGNPSSKSPSLCSPGEPFHGPECSEGLSVHSPMADSFCCGPSASGVPPRADVLDGFNGGSTSLSSFVDPSIPLIGPSPVGPIHPVPRDLGVRMLAFRFPLWAALPIAPHLTSLWSLSCLLKAELPCP